MQILTTIIKNVLTALYQPFWYALFASALLGFLYLYAYHPTNTGKGIKEAIKGWLSFFKTSMFFRKLFAVFFFTVMILFRTLLNRDMWANPLSDVMGGWWIWKNVDGEQKLTAECFENLILLLPFVFLFLWTFEEKIQNIKLGRMFWLGIKIAFVFSITIEMLQLILRLGTWQLSDIFYNTLGGGLGGVLYYGFYRIKSKRKGRERKLYDDSRFC